MLKKAIIPIAGKGSRLAPLTAAVPKALFPLVDSRGRCRAILHWIAAQAAQAGIEELAIVASPPQRAILADYLEAAAEYDPPMPAGIQIIIQPQSAGFGDAVACARPFIQDQPFMLLLGDHICLGQTGAPSCAAQVARAFVGRGAAAMVAVQEVAPEQLALVGAARGVPLGDGLYRCSKFIEKPSLQQAAAQLRTDDLPENRFLAHAGIYIFSPEIFDCLDEARQNLSAPAELELAAAQSILLKRHANDYYLIRIKGQALDVGTAENFASAQAAFRQG